MTRNLKLFFATVTSLTGALLLSSCMAEPELKPNFGAEVSQAEFSKMLGKIEQPDPYTIKKDEYAYIIRSTNIADQIYQIDKRWAYTVTNKADVGNDHVFTYVREVHEYDSKGAEKISTDQDQVSLEKKTPMIPAFAAANIAKNLSRSFELSPFKAAASILKKGPPVASDFKGVNPLEVLGSGLESKRLYPQSSETLRSGITPKTTTKVTFHNAKLQETNVAVPDFVQQRANCGGLTAAKCRGALKAYMLSYDQVIWEGEEGQRYTVSWVFSPDVPFFGSTMFPNPAGVIQSCSSTQMPYQGSRIKITQCDEIKDFTFGQ